MDITDVEFVEKKS